MHRIAWIGWAELRNFMIVQLGTKQINDSSGGNPASQRQCVRQKGDGDPDQPWRHACTHTSLPFASVPARELARSRCHDGWMDGSSPALTHPHRSMDGALSWAARVVSRLQQQRHPSIHGPGRVMRCTHLQQTLLEFGTLHAAAPLVGSTQQSAEPSFTSTRPGSTRDSTMHSKEIKGAKGIESLPLCCDRSPNKEKGPGWASTHVA